MQVSVSENEIVCYVVGNAITNAKVRGPGPRLEESEGARAPFFWSPVPTPMLTSMCSTSVCSDSLPNNSA